ncbi:hypothetical protein [Hydrogenophaga sp. T2]|uniref:hypothetical protein n=1 Tax=Hydrogenophaga sp. T2 TaxID=3132823 RepID=UPI003CECB17B
MRPLSSLQVLHRSPPAFSAFRGLPTPRLSAAPSFKIVFTRDGLASMPPPLSFVLAQLAVQRLIQELLAPPFPIDLLMSTAPEPRFSRKEPRLDFRPPVHHRPHRTSSTGPQQPSRPGFMPSPSEPPAAEVPPPSHAVGLENGEVPAHLRQYVAGYEPQPAPTRTVADADAELAATALVQPTPSIDYAAYARLLDSTPKAPEAPEGDADHATPL